ncbi:MAG: DNA polymerase III subunit delta [Gammaproteobacteria bacterium]|nr:DNA polymerase III subunit delta [Gammaproteobacteria bacterium]MBU1553673.1 DNA polymerase III subunit delta [Gammaproteobacteria bacterium]MBU2071391.1 DNA polymerase III subunit delta [Gammaproteobacteria bacterium]MBU2182403.1 DNA polymerase III subunit delta [Gammaproteobacteria bacterium]MBU2204141.1 DNA polymerase III subunit delta [Gammaproteobacteria bacterium]
MQKLYANQLAQHLATQLAPCYLLFGEEPLQKLEAIDAIRLAAKAQGYNERLSFSADAQFDWQELSNELNAMSLFADKRLIELELVQQKLSAQANDQLKALPQQLHSDVILLIHGERSHSDVSKLAWFKQLQTQAVQIPVYPLDERQSLQWLRERSRQLKLQLSSDALALLQQHCAGNLLAARQELEKLALSNIQTALDANALSQFLADHSSFTVFQLLDAVLAAHSDEALHRLQRLCQQDTEPVIIAWQLQKEALTLRELAQAQQDNQPLTEVFKRLAIWPKRQPLYQQALKRLNLAWLDYLLAELAAFDRLYKSGQLDNSVLALAHLVTLFMHPVGKVFSLHQLSHD